MLIKNLFAIGILSLGLSSYSHAKPATEKQIQQLIEQENWANIKSLYQQQPLTKSKEVLEKSLALQLSPNTKISANQQALIMQMADIIINDAIEHIDTERVQHELSKAFSHYSYEQAQAILKMYQHPEVKKNLNNTPSLYIDALDLYTDDFQELLQSENIQKFIMEQQQK